MGCTVYCLAPSPKDVGPLLERLRAAGISADDTTIVQRGEACATPAEAGAPAQWWSVPLAPAALWWAALYSWPGAVHVSAPRRAPADAEGHAVISLSRYRVVRMAR